MKITYAPKHSPHTNIKRNPTIIIPKRSWQWRQQLPNYLASTTIDRDLYQHFQDRANLLLNHYNIIPFIFFFPTTNKPSKSSPLTLTSTAQLPLTANTHHHLFQLKLTVIPNHRPQSLLWFP